MAVTSDVYVSVKMTGDLELDQTFPMVQNVAAPGDVDQLSLGSGFNAITVPATAKGAIIIPAITGVVALTLKGVTGDTGIALSKNSPNLISFDTSPPVTIGITTGSATTLRIVWT